MPLTLIPTLTLILTLNLTLTLTLTLTLNLTLTLTLIDELGRVRCSDVATTLYYMDDNEHCLVAV